MSPLRSALFAAYSQRAGESFRSGDVRGAVEDLDRATLAGPSSELKARVLMAAPVTPWRRRLIALWSFGPAWQPASALATACVLGIVAGLATGGAETLDADTLGDEIGLLALGPQYQLEETP